MNKSWIQTKLRPLVSRWMHTWMRSCKEVTLLALIAQDRPLTRSEQWRKQWHQALCSNCTRFDKQLLTMRNGLKQWRVYEESDNSAP